MSQLLLILSGGQPLSPHSPPSISWSDEGTVSPMLTGSPSGGAWSQVSGETDLSGFLASNPAAVEFIDAGVHAAPGIYRFRYTVGAESVDVWVSWINLVFPGDVTPGEHATTLYLSAPTAGPTITITSTDPADVQGTVDALPASGQYVQASYNADYSPIGVGAATTDVAPTAISIGERIAETTYYVAIVPSNISGHDPAGAVGALVEYTTDPPP